MMDQEAVVTAQDDVGSAGPTVGAQLSQAREACGLRVSDIAQTLKLGQRQVEALESGDWANLPGPTFIRGFVRNYARLVQLDPVGLMAQLDGVLEKPVATLAVPEMRPGKPTNIGSGGRRDRTVILWAGFLLLCAAGLYFLMPNDLSALRDNVQSLIDSIAHKETPAPEAPAAVPDPVLPPGATTQQVLNPQAVNPVEQPVPATAQVVGQAPAGVVEQPVAARPAEAAQLRFVADKESWVEVRDRDNKVVFSQRMVVGAEQAVGGQGPLSLIIGYAPGVRLFWRGQAIDLTPHTRGDVARLVLE